MAQQQQRRRRWRVWVLVLGGMTQAVVLVEWEQELCVVLVVARS